MNLVIIGYRGTGKSTIGKLLSAELGMPLVSLDAEIVKRAGVSIPEIVARHSWEHFRDKESEVVADFAGRDGLILDTGGGVVTRPANVQLLRKTGMVFLLVSEISDIVRRIGGDTQRPSLTGAKSFTEEVAEVLAVREPLYRAAADHTVDTSRLSPEAAAREIAVQFRSAPPRRGGDV
jgi:shikimate kinase